MSGTRSTDDRQQRADHEAGHYVTAFVLGIVANPLWVTIEPREETGGSTKIDLKKGTGFVPKLQYFLGGIAGEALEGMWRQYQGSGATLDPAEIHGEIVEAFNDAQEQGGHGDVLRINALLEEIPTDQRPNVADVLWDTFTLLTNNRTALRIVSDALLQRETLYTSEASFLLTALGKPEAERDHMLGFYKKHWTPNRQVVPAPEGWLIKATDEQKRKPFYEGPVEYFQRMTGQVAPPPMGV